MRITCIQLVTGKCVAFEAVSFHFAVPQRSKASSQCHEIANICAGWRKSRRRLNGIATQQPLLRCECANLFASTYHSRPIQLLFVGAHIAAHCTRSSRSRDMTFVYSFKGHRMSCASPRTNRQPHFGKSSAAALAASVIKRHTFHAKHCAASGNVWGEEGRGEMFIGAANPRTKSYRLERDA